MVVKGEIPVIDENYDLTSGDGVMRTGKNAVAAIIGVGMAFGIFAGGRALWNKVANQTDAAQQVEVF